MKNPQSPELDDIVIVKKYPNRRLYNTQTSSYITFEQLTEMVKANTEFAVIDAKTGANLTRSVLIQMILEQETSGSEMLSADFLKQLIRYYNTDSHQLLSGFVQQMSHAFGQQMQSLSLSPTAKPWDEWQKIQQDWWEKSMGVFGKK